MKEAMVYYASIIPPDTARAKVSMANIGRSVIERYPILAVADRPQPWTHFNEKLLSYLRNSRNRIKHKLNAPATAHPLKFVKVASVCQTSRQLSEDEYSRYISDIKAESSKQVPDVQHLKELTLITYSNRRRWIDNTPSSQLRMATVFENDEIDGLHSSSLLRHRHCDTVS